MSEGRDAELERIADAYEGYAGGTAAQLWDPANRGNRHILRERLAAIEQALERRRMWPPSSFEVLDVGCGTGDELARFAGWGADRSRLVGVDLLADRIERARVAHPGITFVRANAAVLPFASERFGLVVASTIFSSILDPDLARAIASEIDRVLIGSGSVLWYDVRLPNPSNPNTRAIRAEEVLELFGGYDADLRSLTVLPPLARRLGPLTSFAYPALAAVPLLRSHLVGTLRKPAAGPALK